MIVCTVLEQARTVLSASQLAKYSALYIVNKGLISGMASEELFVTAIRPHKILSDVIVMVPSITHTIDKIVVTIAL